MTKISQSIIPISRLNRGMAAQVIDEVNENNIGIVVRHNEPICVILSVQEYERMVEEMEDMKLAEEAFVRMSETHDRGKWTTHTEMMARHGITKEMLDAMEEVDFE